ncbi:nickel pincer cofactor biosynthesis protein LarB [Thermodesulfobacteriota bacterium]
MDKDTLLKLLDDFKDGQVSRDSVFKTLKKLPFENIGIANIDHHRAMRSGYPEMVFGEPKSADQIVKIVKSILKHKANIIVTRVDEKKAKSVMSKVPDLKYSKDARTLTMNKHKSKVKTRGTILVITAGTSDIPVAEEAAITAEVMGNKVKRLFDVGVAGLHRLLNHYELIDDSSVLIVVAGMEGALPSVVAGLVDKPVIALPTSIGYGSSFGGVTALLSMLNSCASGVSVVNIDNGFGAGYAASLINRQND